MSTTQQEQTRAAASQEYLLEMRGITKAFAGVQALKGVDFYVRPGTVHALMGENGAGKSTLMKCLFGIYHKDEGTIKLRGAGRLSPAFTKGKEQHNGAALAPTRRIDLDSGHPVRFAG